jgi:hypothetical protein
MIQSLFYLTIALHVSGIIITHIQGHKTTVTAASSSRYTVLLPVVIVEELEPTGLSVFWVAYATHNTLKPVPTLPR